MILIDFSNLVFSTVLDFHAKTKEQSDISLLRHLIIGRLRTIRTKLKAFDDEVVICCDSRSYWRRDIFPFYKAKRKEQREAATFDWDSFFKDFEDFKQELRDHFPVKVIEVDGAEADDVIAVLAMAFGPHRSVCIVSSDKDFLQIQQRVCPKVKQWSIFHKKFIDPAKSNYDLFEHVVRGDVDDGVPNILSSDDCIVTPGQRQKPITAKKLEVWKQKGYADPTEWCPDLETLKRFKRNEELIDLTRIPQDVTQRVRDAYDEYKMPSGKLFNYFVANRLNKILKEGGW